jgi:hypothetical protein
MYGLQSLEAEEYVKDSAINSTKSGCILESSSQLHNSYHTNKMAVFYTIPYMSYATQMCLISEK